MRRASWIRTLCLIVVLVFAIAAAAQSAKAPQVVDLTAADGTNLKATFFAAGKPGPGVILFHQCNQQRKNWDDLAGRLAAAGINVLTVDYRGFGESGGQKIDRLPLQERQQMMTETWPNDMDKAFAYLVSQSGVKRDVLGAGGASCGVNQAIQLARRHSEVKSLVLLSGTTDQNGREFLKSSAKLPLFGSAADDDAGAVVLMEWILGLSGNPGTRFEHYTTGGHGTEMFAAHKELPGMIVDWYTTTLIKTPGRAPEVPASARVPKTPSIMSLIDEPGGAAKAAAQLDAARKKDPNARLFPEAQVNLLGYEHMQSGDTKGAIEILKLNQAAYPRSANTYDSLSDAYLADGQKDLAREWAQKTLNALAQDDSTNDAMKKMIRDSAEQKLKQLGEKE